MNRSIGQLILGVSLIGMALAVFAFLAVWYWEVVLWIILLPLPLSSLYLGLCVLKVSTASYSALIYWFLSVIWVLGFALVIVQDVTIGGILVSGLIACGIGLVSYRYMRLPPVAN